MKIGIITNLYPPYSRGGAEVVIVRTVAELLAQGHDVFVIAGAAKSVVGRAVNIDRSSTERIYRFFPNNIYFTLDDHKYPWLVRLAWHVVDAFSWHGARVVSEILRDETPDVVITHNLKGLGLRIPAAIRRLKIRHLHVVHDMQLIIPSGLMMFGKESFDPFTKLCYRAYATLCKKRFGNPDTVIFPSKFLQDQYQKAGLFPGSRSIMMPNPAPDYKNVVKDGRSSGPLRLLFVGQLGVHKGLAFLLDVIRDYSGDLRLSIAGDGPLRPLVEERVAGDRRIVYLGFTSREDIPSVIASSDALIVPSLCYENSPTVIYESLQTGVPVLASRIGGVGELIVEGQTGFLFGPGNSAEMLAAIAAMDARKEEFAKARQRMRDSIAPHAIHSYVQKIIELCK